LAEQFLLCWEHDTLRFELFFHRDQRAGTAKTNQFYYTLQVTNLAGISLSSGTAVLTVLPDEDRDGLPDDWETANGLISTNAATPRWTPTEMGPPISRNISQEPIRRLPELSRN
jgi:hypothetical protein